MGHLILAQIQNVIKYFEITLKILTTAYNNGWIINISKIQIDLLYVEMIINIIKLKF